MENYFLQLNKIECKIEKKKDLTYISWSDAWTEVKKLYPESTYTIYENHDGFPFWDSIYGIDVKVGVTINGLEHIVRLPVMDGNNNAMLKESYTYQNKYGEEKKVEAADAFDINKSIQRAFTKAIAMHWIGLYVYRGEDLPSDDEKVRAPKKDILESTFDQPFPVPEPNGKLPWHCDVCGSKMNPWKDWRPPYCYTCWKNKNK